MKTWQKILFAIIAMSAFPVSAHAYIGPGVGIGAIILTLAVGLGILFLLFGLVWYPLKRLLSKAKPSQSE